MQLRYDDDFVEGSVFVCANSRQHAPPPLQVRRFHRERERLYSILDPDERNTAFFKLHLEWFREWWLEKMLLDVANEYPLLRTALSALVFRKARVKNDEGAELYVNSGTGVSPVQPAPGDWTGGTPTPLQRVGVVALRVERFEQQVELARFLRHEFMHLHDMVNPEFGYSPQLHLPGQNAAQQRVTRERYRLLWDITIDGRLAGKDAGALQEQYRAVFDRAFNFWPEEKRNEVFHGLWRNPKPHHGELLAIASDPRELKTVHEPTPGAPCPLCGFATFDWAVGERLGESTVAAIQKEFPSWTREQGACGRCVEIYRHVGAQSLVTA